VSACNQLAARAVDEIAADPGRRYNPLFLHGAAGNGKTHLANALGNELVDSSGGAARVAVVRAADFMDELIAALQAGTVGLWRARYRVVDALILDDVQQLVDTERTQDELFHLFNALYSDGKQLVIVSDRPPRALEGLEERLRSRFEGGLVAELQAPDRQLRERLAARVLSDADPTVAPELITWFAEPQVPSVSELLSRLQRVADSVAASGAALTVEHARRTLEGGGDASAAAGPALADAAGTVAGNGSAASSAYPPGLRLSGSMRTGALRPSGSMLQVDPDGPGDTFFRDTEKVVWEWPDTSRIIEDPR
jgi:chromosomal replication initiator protein